MSSILSPLLSGAKKNLLNLAPYQTAKPLTSIKKHGKSEVINLASNENPFPPSETIQTLFNTAWSEVQRYPDPSGIELKLMIAERLNLTIENLTLTNGSSEAISLLIQVFAEPGDDIIISETAYALYETCINIQGAVALKVKDNNWVHDLVAMQNVIKSSTKMIIFANPNNPTGSYITELALNNLLETTPQHIIIVVDEAYFEYVTDLDYPDSIVLQKKHPNLVITRSFSKIYALAGLRIGYCIADPFITELLNRVRLSFSVNILALSAAKIVWNDRDYVKQTVVFIKAETEKIIAQLRAWDIPFLPPSANFVMMEFKHKANKIFDLLLQHGILIRPLHHYHLPHHLRMSIGTTEENRQFLQVLNWSLEQCL